MTVEFILDISSNEDLMFEFEGLDELELKLDVDVTDWDKDDWGMPFIGEFEVRGAEVYGQYARWMDIDVDGEIGRVIVGMLENNTDFYLAVYTAAHEEHEDIKLERKLSQLAEVNYEMAQ